jgi:hypothetical protein
MMTRFDFFQFMAPGDPHIAPCQVPAVKLQKSKAGHHANHRWKVQHIVHRDGHGDRGDEKTNHNPGAILKLRLVGNRFGLLLAHGETENGRSDHPVHNRWNEQGKKLLKLDHPLLPDHQGRDVAKRAEGAACIGGHHDVDAGDSNEFFVASSHSNYHGRHQQGGGQIIRDG